MEVYSDSQLIVGQVNSDYKAQEQSMVKYIQKVKELTFAFYHFKA